MTSLFTTELTDGFGLSGDSFFYLRIVKFGDFKTSLINGNINYWVMSRNVRDIMSKR